MKFIENDDLQVVFKVIIQQRIRMNKVGGTTIGMLL